MSPLLDGISMKWPRGDVIPGRVQDPVFLRIKLRSFFRVFLRAKCFLKAKIGIFRHRGAKGRMSVGAFAWYKCGQSRFFDFFIFPRENAVKSRLANHCKNAVKVLLQAQSAVKMRSESLCVSHCKNAVKMRVVICT